MARTTGVVLAIGGITIANRVIFNNQDMDWKVPIATGLAAGMFALLEKGWEKGAVALSWVALLTILLARIDPKVPSPAESALKWYNK